MHRWLFIPSVLFALAVVSAATGHADESYYSTRIRPLLKERCYACHGALKQEAGLRLDTGALLRKGSENGSVIDVSAVDESLLLDRLSADDDDYRMPPDGKPLTAVEVQHFREWMAAGAVSPDDETPEPDPSDHWAFRRPIRPAIPIVANDDWSRNAIDLFIQQRHESLGLSPAPDAAAEHLLRRVTLDLIGIPPTPDQLRRFVDDPSPEHYGRVVDELLASRHYGERWGRHWMDVWRYSDWYGRRQQNDVRNSAPQIWRWRDWIVDSLNEDKSYARMIQEMLAADEIAADDDSAWAATGYLIRSYYSLNPNEWMRHNVEFTGKAFLGLTFNCAHCHDHKYDPITHDDYFRMRAFFEPMGIRQDRVVGEPEPLPFEPYKYGGSRKVVRTGMVRIFDEKPHAKTWFYTGGDERNRLKDRGSIIPGVPTFLDVPFADITSIDLPMSGWYPGSRPNLQRALLDEHSTEVKAAETALSRTRQADINTTALVAEVQTAQAEFKTALLAAIKSGQQGALAGTQSLLIDAPDGRRIVQHELPDLKQLPDETTIRFKVAILNDGHFNFQLSRDTTKGLTALYLGFTGGTIKAYRPGTFTEFVVGQYPLDQLQGTLHVSLSVHPATDVATLNIDAVTGEARTALVSGADIALNGWNPAKNAHQPFTLDCRTGTQVLIDDVHVTAGDQAWSWNFEPAQFVDGRDVAGVHGWTVHPQSTGTATSTVSAVAGCQSAQAEHKTLQAARASLAAASSKVQAATLRLEAANTNAVSIHATIAADNAARNKAEPEDIERLSRRAYFTQLTARDAGARWRILDAERQLGVIQSLPDSDKQKKSLIKELQTKIAASRDELKSVTQQRGETPESAEYRRLSPTTPQHSTGRRSALAAWITHPRNPLTPRVAINHIWLRHFHSPLVQSVYDFGRNGKPPTHPELLDWLAVELVDNNWSMKHIHRLIVTSRSYRMNSSSRGLNANMAVDSENQNLWRMNSGRMEAEVVRDSVLAVAGVLDATIGGEVRPNTEALTTFRRSLYYEVYPENGGHNAMADVFDAPDPGECFRRTSTVLPQQALALSNSKIIHSSAQQAALQIAKTAVDDNDKFVNQAFQRVLSRMPDKREHDAAIRFLQQQFQQGESAEAARESIVRVLFNHNDFVTVR
ncbi:MAG: PSD1 and planctomycete cytochrome C domain-containing protein [Fuerstiella sp.]